MNEITGPSPSSLQIEQAVFTSVRGPHNEGYQLAASSPGLPEATCRQLAQWGPAHDALQPGRRNATSFTRLPHGPFVLSRTMTAGQEYSLRGGMRLYTQFFVLPPEVAQRFSYHPFRLMEAVIAAGHCQVLDPLPQQLESFRLVGRASPAQASMLAAVTREVGHQRIAAALTAALTARPLAIDCPTPHERLFATLFDLLPLNLRTQMSFTVGLRYSPRRPYRWYALSHDPRERRRLQRIGDLLVIDLKQDVPARLIPTNGWARLMADLLKEQKFTEVREAIVQAKDAPLSDCDRRADEIWQRWKEAGNLRDVKPSPNGQPPTTRGICQTDSDCRGVPLTPQGDTAR